METEDPSRTAATSGRSGRLGFGRTAPAVIRLTRSRTLLLSLAASALVLAVPPALSSRVRLAAAGFFEPVTGTLRALGGGLRSRLAAFGRGTRLEQELVIIPAQSGPEAQKGKYVFGETVRNVGPPTLGRFYQAQGA